ncbi:MAG TPA: cytochrome c [Terriglobales bacterium]|nr:cytochrome c [Terriglobales bacterium]
MKVLSLLSVTVLLAAIACRSAGEEKYKMTDAQLGLTAEQARGRQVFNARCLRCHESYTSDKRQGFPLKGLYSRPVMPSGTPLNDECVAEVIVNGKRMMPGTQVNDADLKALIAYLKTL